MSSERWQRIDAVFHEAVGLEPAERIVFLEKACAGDESIRREVESLLAHDVENGTTLGNAVDAAADVMITDVEDLVGRVIGPYHVQERIGIGGMGVVFKALDTRLNRSVAIKVSAAQFSGSFVNEARAVAALNHPHVCTLYDVGPNYLVMELVEGAPLKGPLPVEKAVEYAGQILDALDAAHRKRITHRDLKPANILVTRHGIKLLDFGLARQAGAVNQGASTPEGELGKGQIAGTLQYMSPEQLQGQDADARSDIFSFGCVLYELLSGERAFTGSSMARDTASIPQYELPSLDRVIRTCLAPDPEQRFQTAVDLKRALEWAASVTAAQRSPSRLRPWPWIIAGLATVVAFVIATVHFLQAPRRALTTFTVFPEEKTALTGQVAVAPDGLRIAFVARDPAGNRHLWLRSMDSSDTHRLTGTEGAYFPTWSPDSQWIGFGDPYHVKKIHVPSGQVLMVADAGRMVRGLAWTPDGSILFGTQGGPILRVAATGGIPERLTVLDPSRQEVEHEYPSLLPGARRLLFFVNSRRDETNGIWVTSLARPADRKRVLADHSAAAYSDGYLMFVRGGALMAQPFDPERAELSGAPESVVPRIGYSRSGDGAFGASPSNVLAWSPVQSLGSKARLTWFDRSGAKLGDFGPVSSYNSVSLSPDGTQIAASNLGTPLALLVLDSRLGTANYLHHGGAGLNPVWSPDSSRVAYAALRQVRELFVQSAAGAGEAQMILENGKPKVPTSWSRDGRILLYQEMSETSNRALWTITMDQERQATRFVPPDYDPCNGQFSPDGRWVAYAATESPVQQIYVQSFPPGRGKWQVSTNGGGQPRWRRDGRELFYIEPSGKMMAVKIEPGDTFQPRPPNLLFTFRGSNNPYGTFYYDVTADGRKFLIVTPVEDASFDPLHVVLNWTAGLKARQ